MIRIAITVAAYHAIRSTLPVYSHLWPVHHRDGQCASSTSTGQFLTVEELRHLAKLERSRAHRT
jgi:hypothetical protein